jgi:hypothetical protein
MPNEKIISGGTPLIFTIGVFGSTEHMQQTIEIYLLMWDKDDIL